MSFDCPDQTWVIVPRKSPDVLHELPIEPVGAAGRHIRSDPPVTPDDSLHDAPIADRARPMQPYDGVGPRNSSVKCGRVISVYDPPLTGDGLVQPGEIHVMRDLNPVRLPEQLIDVNHRQAAQFAKRPRKGGFAGSRAADHEHALHDRGPSSLSGSVPCVWPSASRNPRPRGARSA